MAKIIDGRLGGGDRQSEIDAHLDACAPCRMLISELAKLQRATAVGTPAEITARATEGDEADPSSVLPPRYQVRALLGRGGMGTVFAAYDTLLRREVALKILHSAGADAAARERLRREAQAMAQLAHPNVVTVHDIGEHRGHLFIAMEYVDGQNLSAWLAERPRSVEEVVGVMRRAGEGLAVAHAAGLTHRDFKPDNVLIARDARVLVADFGLAFHSSDIGSKGNAGDNGAEPAVRITRGSATLGTPAYMAPEQHRADGTVDARSDQFAFAASLFEALAGTRPFPGSTAALIAENKRLGKMNSLPSTVGQPLREVVRRGLAADPAKRYDSMRALLAALPDGKRPASHVLKIGAGVAVVAAAGLAAVLLSSQRSSPATNLCDRGDATWNLAWNNDRRNLVEESFAASGKPYAADQSRRTAALIDAYHDEWRTRYQRACTPSQGETQPTELAHWQMACLDGAAADVGALVDELSTAADSARVVDESVKAATHLPALARCTDTGELLRRAPSHVVLTGANGAAARKALAVARARDSVGEYVAGLEQAEQGLELARGTGNDRLIASALWEVAQLQASVGDAHASLASLRETGEVAARAGDLDRVAQAWTLILYLMVESDKSFKQATETASFARVAVEQAGRPALRARLLIVEAILFQRHGDMARAKQNFERGLALHIDSLGADHLDVAKTHANFAGLLFGLGEWDAGNRHLARAITIFEATLGPDHPLLGMALDNASHAARAQGDFVRADELVERALTILTAAFGADHLELAPTLRSVGMLRLDERKFHEAREYLERGRLILEHNLGENHPAVAAEWNNIGAAYLEQGDHPSALAAYARARKLLESNAEPDHPFLITSLIGEASCHAAMGNPAAAAAEAQRALELVTAAGGPPDQRRAAERLLAAASTR